MMTTPREKRQSPSLSLTRRQTLQQKPGIIRGCPLWVRMRSRSRNWSLIRQWVGNSAL